MEKLIERAHFQNSKNPIIYSQFRKKVGSILYKHDNKINQGLLYRNPRAYFPSSFGVLLAYLYRVVKSLGES